jgi:hypothetical protein
MFDFWMDAATKYAAQFSLRADLAMNAHAFVLKCMGADWVSAHCTRRRLGAERAVSEIHPLALALRGGTQECVLDVLRLASYLCAFRSDPKFDEAITSLREANKYDPTIFELAIAWSLGRAGAEIALFPQMAKGSADVLATIEGKVYPIETSGFPSDALRDDAMSFSTAMHTALVTTAAKLRYLGPIALEIEVEDLDSRDRSPAHAAVGEIVRALRDANGVPVRREFSFGRMAARLATPGEPVVFEGWTNAIRKNYGHLIYLRDLSDEPDPIIRLQKKLKREAKQLSGCSDGVIVLDIEALGVDVINDRERLRAVAFDFARSHTSTTGIAFVVMAYQMNGHRGVSGHYFALASTALAESWFQRVCDRDEGDGLLDELRMLDSVGA